MSNLLSPGIQIKEFDLSGSVQTTATSAAAFAAPFRWGPANTPTLVTSETNLVSQFGKPTLDNNQYWLCASSFLAYADTLYVSRALPTLSVNATAGTVGVQIHNDSEWEIQYQAGQSSTSGSFAARFPGTLGNGLLISVADSASFATWTYKDLFSGVPGTSAYALARGGTNDEMHMVVIDVTGDFSGTVGGVLETYPFVSKGSDAKDSDGGSSFYKTVIYTRSSYVHWMDHLPATNIGKTVGGTTFGNLVADLTAQTPVSQPYTVQFAHGLDSFDTLDDADLQTAWDVFKSPEAIDIAMAFAGPASVSISQYIIDNISTARKDIVSTHSPQLADVRGSGIAAKVVAAMSGAGGINRNTSYAIMDGNWKLMYDRYNEVNVWIPCNADVAGLMARVDTDRDPWWSPAGFERGVLKNVLKLAWNPVASERDLLYKNSVNPILTFTGKGPILYGDKTMLTKTSAFDRINVRRLFNYLEKEIGTASKDILFEFNDTFTRAQFVNMVEPFLRMVAGRRGIYRWKVICDETNNTSAVIDANQFVATIMVAPARSINFITINFVSTRTGQDFSELTGSV